MQSSKYPISRGESDSKPTSNFMILAPSMHYPSSSGALDGALQGFGRCTVSRRRARRLPIWRLLGGSGSIVSKVLHTLTGVISHYQY